MTELYEDSNRQVPVVLHFRGGATSHVFAPRIERERETVVIVSADGKPDEVPFGSLKAIFFLRDPNEPLRDPGIDQTTARDLVVEFQDGETIRGISAEYAPDRNGFFLFPADRSKNDRIFVVNSAIVSIEVEKI